MKNKIVAALTASLALLSASAHADWNVTASWTAGPDAGSVSFVASDLASGYSYSDNGLTVYLEGIEQYFPCSGDFGCGRGPDVVLDGSNVYLGSYDAVWTYVSPAVPETSNLGLMLVGLSVVAATARRCKSR